ncbi:MAG: ATP-dependent DNA helicase RecG [Ginsengibacter sp.]
MKAELLKKELHIFTFKDLLELYPFRHIDKTKIYSIGELDRAQEYVQVKGILISKEILGEVRSKRLVGLLKDDTGIIEMVWFQGVNWIEKQLILGVIYIAFGKWNYFQNQPQISHPEIEVANKFEGGNKSLLEPIYPSTEKLKARSLGGRQLGKLTQHLISLISERDVTENLPENLLRRLKLYSRYESLVKIHFPNSNAEYLEAVKRIKFEELFFSQLRLGMLRAERTRYSKGVVFGQVGANFNDFYHNNLPFELTGAQKRVLKEIRKDIGSGKQMNRLLQGDVGSGKTIVALLTMLISIDNGYQACLMAPTEILAQQHFLSISSLVGSLSINVALLTGSTKPKDRKRILTECENGSIHILLGTHSLIEDKVVFKNLGLAIVDEQHKFGVQQRARLWKKSTIPPHILVMTATPIPRTLALTAYGDLDFSIIDELPPGRQPIVTSHRNDSLRHQIMDFIKKEISIGRQAYIIYPLIEESEKLDYENLMKGYEEVKAYFPEPKYWISMLHGQQKPEQKKNNMERFVNKDTQIMVSTTVIEVGVNVPNASIMVIESAEKFGLPQLHQLRGRVGRGSEKSYCILLTGNKLSKDAVQRLKIMCETNDGFVIAEKDLEIRGPGEIEGTRQSGILNFRLADLVKDKKILEFARLLSQEILDKDPLLDSAENLPIKTYMEQQKGRTLWSKIS